MRRVSCVSHLLFIILILMTILFTGCASKNFPLENMSGGKSAATSDTPDTLWWEAEEQRKQEEANEEDIDLKASDEDDLTMPEATEEDLPNPSLQPTQRPSTKHTTPQSQEPQKQAKSQGNRGNKCQVDSYKFFINRGPFLEEQIAPVVQSRINFLCSCYDTEMKQNATLFETLTMELAIGRNGNFERLQIKDSTFSVGGQTIACLLDEFGRWHFNGSYDQATQFTLVVNYLR